MDLPQSLGKRTGLLGGTFDPVHNGHLAAAETVLNALQLDSVLFIPAARPPHKLAQPPAPFASRLALLRLALQGKKTFFVTELEAARNGLSYTINTLKDLREKVPADTQLFFIIGIDAFLEITTWKAYSDLPLFAHLVIIDRPPFKLDKLAHFISRNFSRYTFSPREKAWVSEECPGKLIPLTMEPVPVSSTDIRERIGQGDSIDQLVHPDVEKYIQMNGLYKPA
ncbi:MAG: nicotinate-nucleotide adenylyltransferase [Proteobacteria bacterium]|nr:nicotinate-nucleotide adenylyltransferase [Pseudomonadota bacterium]MBU1710982.1 nicotinate-nucleotide adenylyltransferase [Pseudomonadota bacterium]